jgi:hypothetical protein
MSVSVPGHLIIIVSLLALALGDVLTGCFRDWLPNHLLVIHVLFVFAVLNPLVMPFGLIYFTVEKSASLRARW